MPGAADILSSHRFPAVLFAPQVNFYLLFFLGMLQVQDVCAGKRRTNSDGATGDRKSEVSNLRLLSYSLSDASSLKSIIRMPSAEIKIAKIFKSVES